MTPCVSLRSPRPPFAHAKRGGFCKGLGSVGIDGGRFETCPYVYLAEVG